MGDGFGYVAHAEVSTTKLLDLNFFRASASLVAVTVAVYVVSAFRSSLTFICPEEK